MGLIKLVIDTGILLTKVVPYLSMKQIFISVRFKTLNCFRRFICILGDPEYLIKLSEGYYVPTPTQYELIIKPNKQTKKLRKTTPYRSQSHNTDIPDTLKLQSRSIP
ncbi:hypothetical protein YC2023_036089 [Brassica napus]